MSKFYPNANISDYFHVHKTFYVYGPQRRQPTLMEAFVTTSTCTKHPTFMHLDGDNLYPNASISDFFHMHKACILYLCRDRRITIAKDVIWRQPILMQILILVFRIQTHNLLQLYHYFETSSLISKLIYTYLLLFHSQRNFCDQILKGLPINWGQAINFFFPQPTKKNKINNIIIN